VFSVISVVSRGIVMSVLRVSGQSFRGRPVLIGLAVAAALALSLGVGAGRLEASVAASDWCQGSVYWRHAREHVGEEIRVRGRIAAINTPSASPDRPTFIDVGHAYPSRYRFTAVVWNDGQSNDMPVPWPDEAGYLVGMKQCFEGRVYLRNGVPRMRITHFDFVDGVFVG
jgi:hypothetical protein